MRQELQRADDSSTTSCAPRALCGWSPAAPPARTSLERGTDQILSRNWLTIGLFVAIFAVFSLAPNLPRRAELAVDALAALTAGGWCALNFWRCRHAHCLVTGAGWLGLAAFAFVEAGLGRSLIRGDEQLLFLVILAAAVLFEIGWYAMRRTNAIRSS